MCHSIQAYQAPAGCLLRLIDITIDKEKIKRSCIMGKSVVAMDEGGISNRPTGGNSGGVLS